ncbi:lytic transglycosylase domain-containing protein [Rhizobium sp. C4]|uniref:lytic transglycosylase domain-containing protein n=1 Tax=Rhizobium sp. C4 TaxID=1349800 RepID=UPI001E414F44|nr:transglycosylase SLT domain-containing protein [Rhizobium sp. C4]MCD2174952.1 transglycosylase SLT domain-containing protein [Rhizobium sp. C4]
MPRSFSKSAFAVTACGLWTLAAPALPQERASTPSLCKDGALPREQIRALIAQEAERQGADVRLALAIAEQESADGAKTNSPAGARGVMQLMPATADRYDVKDVCDAEDNIRGGVAYIKDLTQRFHGQVMLVAAAYNAGETRVISAGGIPAIAETVNYTALVTNTYFGFGSVVDAGRNRGGRAEVKIAPAAVQIVTAVTSADAPIPMNAPAEPTTAKNGSNTWLGGSVLYVQQ